MRRRLPVTVPLLVLAAAFPAAAAGAMRVDAHPGLSPSFRPGIQDYVTRCNPKEAVRLSITAPSGETLRLNGRPARSGSFHERIRLGVGQRLRLATEGGRRYFVRCLPRDFPHFKVQRFGTPQSQWWLLAPDIAHYVMFLDSHATPVWWIKQKHVPFSSVLFANDEIAWTRYFDHPMGILDSEAWQVHRLDGTHLRTFKTKGSPIDTHDFEREPSGNYLLETYKLRRDVDLRAYGKEKHSNVLDAEVQEQTPDGKLLWRWNSKDHIGLEETQVWPNPRVIKLPDGTKAYDIIHLNSIEPDGDGVVISARRLNAVFRISRKTGDLTWKLGGSRRPESLTVVGDPMDQTFNAQHDARLLPDGDVTVFDNRTGIGAPRGVRFRIDRAQNTATFISQIADPKVDFSGAQGSTRVLPGGNWVEDWGSNNPASELTPAGKVLLRVYFKGGGSYRTTPLPYGRLAASKLRGAMDRMYARRK
ncbi:MAG: hypothetical protein QOH38_876 [Thermoleophilaceae bacterium]|nr:hypothetical protein [Thermoleophilaceae bacterium]